MSDRPGVSTPEAPPLRISWTRVRSHAECAAKGQLIASGHKSPVTDIRNYFPGTVADRCQRQWLSQDHPEMGWMAKNVARIMDAEEETAKGTGDGVVRWRSAVDRSEVRDMCVQAVSRLEDDLDSLLGLSWQPPERQCGWDPAPRFRVPATVPHPAGGTGKIMLVGEIDLLVLRPPGWKGLASGVEVWDLKTTRDDSYWRKTIGQLVFYEIAMWGMRKGEWPVRSGLLQPLCRDTAPAWQFSRDHRTQMFQRIAGTAWDIWAGRLDPSPSKAKCGYCEVRASCPVKGGGRGRVQTWGAGPGAVTAS